MAELADKDAHIRFTVRPRGNGWGVYDFKAGEWSKARFGRYGYGSRRSNVEARCDRMNEALRGSEAS